MNKKDKKCIFQDRYGKSRYGFVLDFKQLRINGSYELHAIIEVEEMHKLTTRPISDIVMDYELPSGMN